MMMLALLLAAAQDGTITARQTTLSVEEVMGGKVKLGKSEKQALEETRRHNRKVEKEFERIRKSSGTFSLPTRRMKAQRTRSLPPSANRY